MQAPKRSWRKANSSSSLFSFDLFVRRNLSTHLWVCGVSPPHWKDGALASPRCEGLCVRLRHFRGKSYSTSPTEEINRLYIKWWNVRCYVPLQLDQLFFSSEENNNEGLQSEGEIALRFPMCWPTNPFNKLKRSIAPRAKIGVFSPLFCSFQCCHVDWKMYGILSITRWWSVAPPSCQIYEETGHQTLCFSKDGN